MRPYILDPDQAQGLVSHFGSIRAAARGTDYSFGAIYGALHRGGGVVKDADVDDALNVEAKLRDEIRLLKRRLEEFRRESDSAERIRETVYELASTTPEPPIWTRDTKLSIGVPGVPMTVWSDWHWSEVVRPEEVNGVNEFDSTIASSRARDLTAKVIDLTVNHMVNPTYPGIVVNLGGDMISGYIHEELQDTNDQYLFVSCFDVQDHIAMGLEALADQFGKVFVPCVPGNHGRSTKKPRMKGRVYTSYEWNIYCQLERYFRNDDRIQFMIPGEADAYYRVYDHRFLLTHGDSLGVKGGDGIIGALGPIMRGAIKVGRSEAQIGRDFETIIMGHWHQWISLKGIVVNGSLKGYDEYARLGLRVPYERPTQALWFVHPKHGITAQWPIYLEALKTANTEWVGWPRLVAA